MWNVTLIHRLAALQQRVYRLSHRDHRDSRDRTIKLCGLCDLCGLGVVLLVVSVVCVFALCGAGVWLAVYPAMPRLLVDDTIRFEGIACRVGECTFVVPRRNGSDHWYVRAQQRLLAHGWTATGRHPGVLDTAPDRYTRVTVVASVALWEQVTVTNAEIHAQITVRRWIHSPWGRMPRGHTRCCAPMVGCRQMPC
jgi:hypothetical protein